MLKQFQDGHFVAKLSNRRFNAVWMDYTLETTANKALKGIGGIIGLTLRTSALMRWFLCRPITAQYAMHYKQKVLLQSTTNYHGMGQSAQKRWNKDVQKLNQIFDDSYIDPFDLSDAPTQLVNIATGAVASSAVSESLTNSLEKGTMISPIRTVDARACTIPYQDLT